MNRKPSEAMQDVKQRRDAALNALVGGVPYIRFIGIEFDRRGDELTGVLKFNDTQIGNPFLPALHGGVTAAFLEVTSIISLSWVYLWPGIEDNTIDVEKMAIGDLPNLPKTIGFTVDYLRPGLPRDAYARATISRSGRRYATVRVEAWQDSHNKLFAQGVGRFRMPQATPE